MAQRRRAAWREWGGLAVIVVAAALFAMVVGGFGASNRLSDLVAGFLVAVVFSASISGWIVLVIPRLLASAVWRRMGFPIDWAVLVAALVGVAAAGSLSAVLILAVLNQIEFARVMEAWAGSSLRVSLIVTLTFGLFIFAQEIHRARLDEAKLALRTKERDEAKARRIASEARLASLESRVHPHFLFNTLNSIASLIPTDPAGAERMTTQLASLLRSSLDSESTPLVPLEQEFAHVRDYLGIERVRLGDRLRFEIEAPPQMLRVWVPRLALQTVVENSVKHVIAPRREGGRIHVSAVANASHLTLTLRDSGPGFSEQAITEGHGLALLRERLVMLYGSGAHLAVVRGDDGPAVVLSIPLTSESPA